MAAQIMLTETIACNGSKFCFALPPEPPLRDIICVPPASGRWGRFPCPRSNG